MEPQVQAGQRVRENFFGKQEHINEKCGNQKIYSCFFHGHRTVCLLDSIYAAVVRYIRGRNIGSVFCEKETGTSSGGLRWEY